MTENFAFLFQYLKKENIIIDRNEFIFQLNSHPESPSLLALSDTLSFFNIDNLATKIDFEDIIHLPKNFIALLTRNNKPFLAVVEKVGTDFKYQEDKNPVRVSKDKFKGIFQNIVLLAEKSETNEVKTNSKFQLSFLLLFGAVFYISFLFLSKANSTVFLFFLLSIVGVYFSIEAIFKEIGIKSKFSESVCNITSSADCDTVIKSKGLNFLEKFNYSNFSISFFVAQVLYLFIMQVANDDNGFFELQFVLLLFSIPITFLSIYHQVKIAKKWCPICLFIIGLLYTEITLIYFTKSISIGFDIVDVIVFLFLFTTIYFFASTMKNIFKIKNEQQEELFAMNRFKRNYKLFKLALNESEKVNIAINIDSLIVGNPNAEVKLTLITNPFCGFCKEAHQIIKKIYKLHKDDICINFQFNYDVNRLDIKSKKIHSEFLQIYFNEGYDFFMESLDNWFEREISPNYDKVKISESKIDEILNQQFVTNKNNRTNFTPCFIINNAIYPKIYDRKELIYFIPELIGDLKESN